MKDLKIRETLFIVAAFLLGSINPLYNGVVYAFLVIAFLINLRFDFNGFRENVRREWKYLFLPLGGALYMLLHYLGSLFFEVPYRPSGSVFELLLMYFLFIPLYVVSAKSFVTVHLLRRFLLALCIGILCFNFVKLFCVTGTTLFTEPVKALNLLYSGRFGGNMAMLGGFVYLEPQAIYIAVAAVISYFFIWEYRSGGSQRIRLCGSICLFLLSLLFLSFTVTKGSILAFLCGALFLTVVYFRRESRKFRLIFSSLVVLGGIVFCLLLPKAYLSRANDMMKEIEEVQAGNYQGGSIAPRLGLMKENFSHFDEFGWVGLGMYKGDAVHQWYSTSPYRLKDKNVTNSHNSFVEAWLFGGIPGLCFMLYYFLAPVLRMIQKKKYSFLVIASLTTIFVAANTCVIVFLVDSKPFVLFLLALFYLCADRFAELQSSRHSFS